MKNKKIFCQSLSKEELLRAVEPPDLVKEEPILLFSMDKGGFPSFNKPFEFDGSDLRHI